MDLFIELGASLEQLEFPVLYASALNGTSSTSPDINTQEKTMAPILDAVIENIQSQMSKKMAHSNFSLPY